MRISKRCEYALRALIDLGIASELGKDRLTAKALAHSERIPVKFLEQILAQLKKAGYVVGARGKLGGYSLKGPMSRVILGDVVRLIDGPLAPIPCVSPTEYRRCSCPDEEHCGLRIVMTDVRAAITGILDRYSLADVVQVTLRKMRQSGVYPVFMSTEGG